MRLPPTDPISPSFSPTVPAVRQALMQIELELALTRAELPQLTPNQQLTEAGGVARRRWSPRRMRSRLNGSDRGSRRREDEVGMPRPAGV
jgi:hypothetical protein